MLDGRVEKFCSFVDFSWYYNLCSTSHHILQLKMWDLDPKCSTLITRSPFWNKSSTLGMYSLTKWLGEIESHGIQMSPILGVLFFKNWRWDSTQGKRYSDIASVILRSIPNPLFHPLSSSKLEHGCTDHYGLSLLQHPQSKLHQDSHPQ